MKRPSSAVKQTRVPAGVKKRPSAALVKPICLKRPSGTVSKSSVKKRPSGNVEACPYWLRGRCVFGDTCWYFHPDGKSGSFSKPSVQKEPSERPSWEQRETCPYWLQGRCAFPDTCWYFHPVEAAEEKPWAYSDPVEEAEEKPWAYDHRCTFSPRLPVKDSTGIFFRVDRSAVESMWGPRWVWERGECKLGTGPMRLRIVGNAEDLGMCEDGEWDPAFGMDLFWDGDCWRSVVLQLAPEHEFEFAVVRVDQRVSHPGLMQGNERNEMHNTRRFSWSALHTVKCPVQGQVIEVSLNAAHCERGTKTALKPATLSPEHILMRQREEVVPRAGGLMPRPPTHAGRQCCYTFDGPEGALMHFCLYLPPGYCARENSAEGGWPLFVFLHSMHNQINGDNNLFYESDTPLRLLCGNKHCPKALQENFIMLTPQCPPDFDRPQGAGIWLRHGWFETSTYAPDVEESLITLIEMICRSLHVDRRRVVLGGCSMGAYATLELTARNPNVFSCATLIAAHYDLDPMDPLVAKLTELQTLPMWFFHAQNDHMCPHDDIKLLVEKIRAKSKAEVRFTSYVDTWSKQGHCADRVALWTESSPPALFHEAHGEELFEWLASQRLAAS